MDILALIRKNLIIVKIQIKRWGQLTEIIISYRQVPQRNQGDFFADFVKTLVIL